MCRNYHRPHSKRQRKNGVGKVDKLEDTLEGFKHSRKLVQSPETS